MTLGRPAHPSRYRPTVEVRVERVRGAQRSSQPDVLATEEPLEIRLGHDGTRGGPPATLGVTMRTPGNDYELVAGFLLAEGVVARAQDLARLSYVTSLGETDYHNVVLAQLAPGVRYETGRAERAYLTSSSCGVCGKANLESLAVRAQPLPADAPRIPDAALRALPESLRRAQRVFAETGGLHAAALFDARGQILSLREDVGRHNAVDKVLGAEFLAGRTPRSDAGLLVSGRASYEILQKALAAGVPFVAAIGAPSSLAVDLAEEYGQTLVGFLRADAYNVYTRAGRVA